MTVMCKLSLVRQFGIEPHGNVYTSEASLLEHALSMYFSIVNKNPAAGSALSLWDILGYISPEQVTYMAVLTCLAIKFLQRSWITMLTSQVFLVERGSFGKGRAGITFA